MNPVLIVVIIVAMSVAAYFVFRRSKPKPDGFGPVPIPSNFPFQQLTPGGVWVCSVVDVPTFAMQLIDQGIQTQIYRSRDAHPEWTKADTLAEYEVIFIDPMAVNVETDPGSPALIVYGIQAAGTCIGTEPGGRPVIVLPHQHGTDWSHPNYLRESARNESEHVRLARNDRALFDHYQGVNDVHPIFP